MAATITVRRIRHEGAGTSVTARVYPEHGHPTSGLMLEITKDHRKDSGRTLKRWLSMLRQSNRNAEMVIEDNWR